MKYRKKPVVIEALQLKVGIESMSAVQAFTGGLAQPCEGEQGGMIIPTLEDGRNGQVAHVASVGDWVIKGTKGEFYPCKPDIFADIYEKAE